MVHCLQSSHGDKVLNCPIVLAMWDVTLMDVPQWIFLGLLWRKLSATLSPHGWQCPFSLLQVGSGRLKVNMQTLRGYKVSAPAWSCLSVAPADYFFQLKWPCMVFSLERKTDSFNTDLSANTPHYCQSPALSDTKSFKEVRLVKTVNLPVRRVRAEGERESLQLSL